MPLIRDTDKAGSVVAVLIAMVIILIAASYCSQQKNACDKKGGELVRAWNGTYQCTKVIK